MILNANYKIVNISLLKCSLLLYKDFLITLTFLLVNIQILCINSSELHVNYFGFHCLEHNVLNKCLVNMSKLIESKYTIITFM